MYVEYTHLQDLARERWCTKNRGYIALYVYRMCSSHSPPSSQPETARASGAAGDFSRGRQATHNRCAFLSSTDPPLPIINEISYS